MKRRESNNRAQDMMRRTITTLTLCTVGMLVISGWAWSEEAAWYDAKQGWIVRVQSTPAGAQYAVSLEVVDTSNELVTDAIAGLATNPLPITGNADSPDISLAFDEATATAYVIYTLGGDVVVQPVPDIARQIGVTPNPLVFGTVRRGMSSTKILTVRNAGETPMRITGIGTPGAPFTIMRTSTCVIGTTVQTARSCLIAVKFAPTAHTTYTSSFEIDTDVGNATVNLSGTGW
jgi:hypothetical protein